MERKAVVGRWSGGFPSGPRVDPSTRRLSDMRMKEWYASGNEQNLPLLSGGPLELPREGKVVDAPCFTRTFRHNATPWSSHHTREYAGAEAATTILWTGTAADANVNARGIRAVRTAHEPSGQWPPS